MNYHYLQVEKSTPEVVRVALNRPEKRNALNLAMMQELGNAFEDFQKDPSLRIVILSSTGKTFCAGLDLLESSQTQNLKKMAETVAQTLSHIYSSPLVTIACLEGDAIAGGAGLVSVCDFALATENAKIGCPEVHRGMVAAVISVFLSRKIPLGNLRQLLLTGDLIDSKQAYEWGLITHTINTNELENTLTSLIEKILKGSPNALKETKKLLQKLSPKTLSQDLEIALATYEEVHISGDAKEGMAAFLEKRNPQWVKKRGSANID